MKILCKLFDHKYNYYLSAMDTPNRQFRCCKRCGQLQEYRDVPNLFVHGNKENHKDWFTLTQRTKKGAEEFFGKLSK